MLNNESQGTNKLFDMMFVILFTLQNGSLLAFDEFDCKLHPLITAYLMLENNLARTFRARGYDVYGALGKARRRILVRMLLDGLSAVNYLVTKKWASYKAVVKAHAEYRRLRRKTTPDEVASQKETTIQGWYPHWMVIRALTGRKINLT